MTNTTSTWLRAGAILVLGVFNPAHAQEKKEENVVVMEKFVAGDEKFDPTGLMQTKPVAGAFGFDKTLMETPRAVTVVSSQMLDSYGIRNSEDVVKAAPSTFTNFRFGLQGNIQMRNQSSDFYFRGMKRIDPQGNFSTRWGAVDSLEFVRGPASPIYGLGRIGGYVNFNPKTGRAGTGKYLEVPTGEVKVTYGSYEKKIASGNVSGPGDFLGMEGGYSVFGYVENGGSYRVTNRKNEQQIVQATISLNVTKALRAEFGTSLQYSYGGLDGGMNRTTTTTIKDQIYWSGNFSYQLDENNDGSISEREARNSYFRGTPQLSVRRDSPLFTTANRSTLGASLIYNPTINDQFYRVVPWQGGLVKGGTITIDQFKAGYVDTSPTLVGGAPVRRQGVQLMVYQPLANGMPDTSRPKVPFFLPPTFDLNPDSFVAKKWDPHMSLGEDYYRARIGAFFFDVVNDYNPDQTYKNQVFIDTHRQVKVGSNGFSQYQQPLTLENKTTFQKKMQPAKWWEVNTLLSANVFTTWVFKKTWGSGDYDWRRDLQRMDNHDLPGTFTSNDRFYSFVTSDGSYNTQPASSVLRSFYRIAGAGSLLDNTFFNKLNVLVGYRYDYIDAKATQPKDVYQRQSATPTTDPYSNTGLFIPYELTAKGHGGKPSMSASLSYGLPFGWRPYATVGRQAVIINDASNGGLNNLAATRTGLLGTCTLLEAGLKGSMLKDRLFIGLGAYDQTRASYDVTAGLGAGAATSTVSRGYEVEMRFRITKRLAITAQGSWSKSEALQSPGTVLASGRDVGFPDVVDANGKVVIPAEAFGWGGRLQTNIPAAVSEYNEIPGQPNHVVSATAAYNFDSGYFVATTIYHQGSFSGAALHTIKVPEATTMDLNLGYRVKKWELYANITNVFDKRVYLTGAGSPIGWLNTKFMPAVDLTFVRKF